MMLDYNPYPGLRVTCVEDDWFGASSPLMLHQIYTVEAVLLSDLPAMTPFGDVDAGHVVLRVAEVRNHHSFDYAFDARRFRPLDETRLEVFRAMLTTAPRELVEG